MTSEPSQLSSETFDFSRFIKVQKTHSSSTSKLVEIEDLSLVTLKLTKSTINYMKTLTTEGMNSEERLNFVRLLSNGMNGDIFEFSTCNRVLYVGFGIKPQEIVKKILDITNLEYVPFQVYQGMDVWRHLVNVLSLIHI